jgi:hypothetical protein
MVSEDICIGLSELTIILEEIVPYYNLNDFHKSHQICDCVLREALNSPHAEFYLFRHFTYKGREYKSFFLQGSRVAYACDRKLSVKLKIENEAGTCFAPANTHAYRMMGFTVDQIIEMKNKGFIIES